MGKKKTRNKEAENIDDADVEQPLSGKPATSQLPRKQSVVWIAFKSVKTKLSLTDEGASPVNWKVIFLVFISLFGSSFNITYLFPFLPEMILTFGYKEVDKGYYAGIIASSMFVGRAFGSYFWGWISDKKGRRPIVLTTVLLIGLCSLAFGFTTNIYFAVIMRMLAGLVNGTVGTAKTMLYEISDNTNQAVGMSIISVAWGLGIITGPAVGGYLANPCKQYPSVFPSEGFFYQFPYMLPSFIAFVVCITAFIIDFIWLPETLYTKVETDIIADEAKEADDDKTSLHSIHTHSKSPNFKHFPIHLQEVNPRQAISCENLHVESEGATYLAGSRKEIHITRRGISFTEMHDGSHIKKSHSDKNISKHFYLDDNNTESNTVAYNRSNSVKSDTCTRNGVSGREDLTAKFIPEVSRNGELSEVNGVNGVNEDLNSIEECKKGDNQKCCATLRNWSVIQLLGRYDVFLSVLLYSLFSFSVIGVEDIFSVWASTDIMLDGLGFEPNEIGTVLGTTSLPLLFLQLFVFPNLVRRLGIKKTLVICTALLMVLTEGMPCIHLLIDMPVTLWVLLLSTNTVMKLMISCVFSSTSLLINNSVEPELAGQVNGLSMTVTAIFRSLAPLVGGFLYSWTVGYASKAIGPPFDISFVFVLFGTVYWLVAIVGVTIPERLNRQKK
ncbi:uncharacterized protein LOC128547219 [Mercenaria mercenaria]|uniref:uncharacterized protein LOC128547219 n=1 Tax=Mercenaria mercenaria TaxID=6596 RepID=UPI00234F7C70|nr:uncharacterized protein LOC128547219 [Mercenaria mercenaria]